jgi:hypothetical protein
VSISCLGREGRRLVPPQCQFCIRTILLADSFRSGGSYRKERREREVREGGGKEEGTSEETVCLSNKEMQSVFLFSLARSKAVLLSCGERESKRKREWGDLVSKIKSRSPLQEKRDNCGVTIVTGHDERGDPTLYQRWEREEREWGDLVLDINSSSPLEEKSGGIGFTIVTGNDERGAPNLS